MKSTQWQLPTCQRSRHCSPRLCRILLNFPKTPPSLSLSLSLSARRKRGRRRRAGGKKLLCVQGNPSGGGSSKDGEAPLRIIPGGGRDSEAVASPPHVAGSVSDPPPPLSLEPAGTPDPATLNPWDDVRGLEDLQRRSLQKLYARGVSWRNKDDAAAPGATFRLSHGGDVEADGNCLFTASRRAMGLTKVGARELRQRTVRRFLEDRAADSRGEREAMDAAIRHLYSPDLMAGWGIHVVQEVKLLARKADRQALDAAIQELLDLGLQRENAAESIYKERCVPVDDAPSWAKYMSISGSPEDEFDIITLQYTEDGLLSIDENRGGHAAAFGDDIAIGALLQSSGAKSLWFKPMEWMQWWTRSTASSSSHITRGVIFGSLHFFLFMKGTGWCGAGADHYEPLIAQPIPLLSQEKAAFVL